MFLEKKRVKVGVRALSSDGTSTGILTAEDLSGFFVHQKLAILSDTQQPRKLVIRRFISDTSVQVQDPENKNSVPDLSGFLVADNARIYADEQDRPGITTAELLRAVYSEEPLVALRSHLVDLLGNSFSNSNPLPVADQNRPVKKPYDEIQVDYDPVTQDATEVRYLLGGGLVTTLNLSYDGFSNLTGVIVT